VLFLDREHYYSYIGCENTPWAGKTLQTIREIAEAREDWRMQRLRTAVKHPEIKIDVDKELMRLSGIICPLCERAGHMATDTIVCMKATACKQARLLFTNGNLASGLAAKAKRLKKERRAARGSQKRNRKNAVSGESTSTDDRPGQSDGGESNNTTHNSNQVTTKEPVAVLTSPIRATKMTVNINDANHSLVSTPSTQLSLGQLQLRKRYRDAQKHGVGHQHRAVRVREDSLAPLDDCIAVLFTGGMKMGAYRPETQASPSNKGRSHQQPTRPPPQHQTGPKRIVKFQTQIAPSTKNRNRDTPSKSTETRTQTQVFRSTLAPL